MNTARAERNSIKDSLATAEPAKPANAITAKPTFWGKPMAIKSETKLDDPL